MLDFHKNKNALLYKNSNKTFPTIIFAYLVIHNNYVTTMYMEAISNIKLHIQQFYLEQYFIQKEEENHFQYLCKQLCASTLVQINFLVK